jgi:hypothetical protein
MMPEESENPLHERESAASTVLRDVSIPNHPSFSLPNYPGFRSSLAPPMLPTVINISSVHGSTTAHAIHEMDLKEKQKQEAEAKNMVKQQKEKNTNEEDENDEEKGKSSDKDKKEETSSTSRVVGPGGNVALNKKKLKTNISFLTTLDHIMSQSLGSHANRPILFLSGSVFLAWIYTMIPTSNYWIYYLVKSQWWVVLTLITYIEIQFVNIPDLSDTSYIVMYIGGFLLAPLTHIIRWILDADNNFAISSLSVLFSFIVVVIVSGIDCFLVPKSPGERRAISSASTSSTMFLAAAALARQNNHSSATGTTASMAWSYSPMFLATRLSLFQQNPTNSSSASENGHGTTSDDGIEPQFSRASVGFILPHEKPPISSQSIPVSSSASPLLSSSSSSSPQPHQSSRTISVSPMNSRVASMESNTNRIPTNRLASYEVELQTSHPNSIQSGTSSSDAAWKVFREFSNSTSGAVRLDSVNSTTSSIPLGMGETHNDGGTGTRTHTIPLTSTDTTGTDTGSRIQSSDSNLVSVSLRDSEYQRNSIFFRRNAGHGGCANSHPLIYYGCGGFLLNIDNYSFLPRYWNIHYSQLINTLKPNTDRRWLWFYTCCFNLFYSIYYVFLIYFTEYFRHQRQAFTTHRVDDDSTEDSESVRDHQDGILHIYLFLFYIVCNTVLRITLKSIGMYLDKQKECSISMYFIAEVMSLFFYYTFYRVLFESITSVLEFLLFQVLHLCSEWILYVGRSTHLYYLTTEYLLERFVPIGFLQQPRLSHRSWQVFITLDFGIRCAVLVVTGYGMLLLLTTIQFVPYLKSHNDLTQSDYDYSFTSVLIAIAVILELLNAIVMVFVYFKPEKLEVLQEVRHCFSLPHFALLAMMIGANLFVNPIFAFTTGVSGLKG